ncbi:MAG TPA: SUMF1/EgtB/PvdO family nonheme iron enzyme, partial [Vicinamibacteria bacterium]|nr:SUMF1/EgtB/PvdO family nonheme iron enzyme [Vicinamibacteria bacterium]
MRTSVALGAVLLAVAALLLVRAPVVAVTDPAHPGMVYVPAGPFVMGNDDEDVRKALASYGDSLEFFRAEVPRRTIDLPAFWIDRTEVTNGMYAAFVAATGHRVPDHDAVWAAPYRWRDGTYPPGQRDHPVVLVSSEDAADYCRWRGLRVPSEEQWEKTARGTDGRTYPWGDRWARYRVAGADQRSSVPLDRLDRWMGWWQATYRGRMRGREVGTYPVGRFPGGASPFGALDMA